MSSLPQPSSGRSSPVSSRPRAGERRRSRAYAYACAALCVPAAAFAATRADVIGRAHPLPAALAEIAAFAVASALAACASLAFGVPGFGLERRRVRPRLARTCAYVCAGVAFVAALVPHAPALASHAAHTTMHASHATLPSRLCAAAVDALLAVDGAWLGVAFARRAFATRRAAPAEAAREPS